MDVLFFGRKHCSYSHKCEALLTASGFNVKSCISNLRGEKLPDEIKNWTGDYIFSFRSYFILPPSLLKKAKYYAVNFHPGAPEYPGTGCINFALYDNAPKFGVTAHLMEESVDTGQIIKVIRFDISKEDTVSSLLAKTHKHLFVLFEEVLKKIVANKYDARLEKSVCMNDSWSKPATKGEDLLKLQSININVSEEKLSRIVRATFIDKYPPFIVLHGYRFNLESDKKTDNH